MLTIEGAQVCFHCHVLQQLNDTIHEGQPTYIYYVCMRSLAKQRVGKNTPWMMGRLWYMGLSQEHLGIPN